MSNPQSHTIPPELLEHCNEIGQGRRSALGGERQPPLSTSNHLTSLWNTQTDSETDEPEQPSFLLRRPRFRNTVTPRISANPYMTARPRAASTLSSQETCSIPTPTFASLSELHCEPVRVRTPPPTYSESMERTRIPIQNDSSQSQVPGITIGELVVEIVPRVVLRNIVIRGDTDFLSRTIQIARELVQMATTPSPSQP